MRSRILRIAFSLVLGSVPVAFAQMDYDLPNGTQLASVAWEPQGASASRYANTADFTNQLEALGSVPAPKDDSDVRLSYSMPPSQQKGESELNQSSLTSRIRLADLTRTDSRQGWRIGDSGVLSYRTRNERWRLVFRYTPDLSAFREGFDHLHAFSLTWQYSFRKRKPAS